MGIISKLKNLTFSSTPPSIGVSADFGFDLQDAVGDLTYENIQKLIKDERIYSILSLWASMAEKAYQGVKIEPEDEYSDFTISESEKKVLKEAKRFLRKINIEDIFFHYTWDLIAFGDVIEEIKSDKSEVIEIKPLPLNNMTIVENESQIKNISAVVENIGLYVKNELGPIKAANVTSVGHTAPQKNYSPGKIIHVSFHNRGQWRKDIRGRNTFSIWSIPPISTLNELVQWKRTTIKEDKKWKQLLKPKFHWELDLADITPDKYQGTWDEKVKKAQDAAKSIIENFKTIATTAESSDVIITTKSATAKVLESTSTSYQDPNGTLEQINANLGTATGTPGALLGDEAKGFTGTITGNVFSSIRVDPIVKKIARAIEVVLEKHLILTLGDVGLDVIERVRLQINPTLPQLQLEMAKTISILSPTGIFTIGELRQLFGYPALPQVPKDMFPNPTESNAITKAIIEEVPGNELNNQSQKSKEREIMESKVK